MCRLVGAEIVLAQLAVCATEGLLFTFEVSFQAYTSQEYVVLQSRPLIVIAEEVDQQPGCAMSPSGSGDR